MGLLGMFHKPKVGVDTVRLSKNRVLGPCVSSGAAFPLGVYGMIPVITHYKELDHVCYMLHGDENIKRFEHESGIYNDLLDDASELSGHEFGQITTMFAQAQPEGWGFTRIDFEPRKKDGSDNQTPLKVRLETTPRCCSPDSISGIITYSSDGSIKKAELTHWVSPLEPYRLTATRSRGKFAVRKVERLGETSKDNTLLWHE